MTTAELQSSLRHLNMTQDEFAKAVGRNPRTIRRYLVGDLEIPAWMEHAVKGMLADE